MLVEQFAEYAISERTSKLPVDVIHHAKRAVIDWTAAFLPGSLVPPATLLEEALSEDLDHGGARLASGRRATLRAAALINGAASDSVEFDDIYRDAGFHVGSPTISAALAAVQTHRADRIDIHSRYHCDSLLLVSFMDASETKDWRVEQPKSVPKEKIP